jgi:hypothetical protein
MSPSIATVADVLHAKRKLWFLSSGGEDVAHDGQRLDILPK